MGKKRVPLPHVFNSNRSLVIRLSETVSIGGGTPIIIAGPCTLESQEHAITLGLQVKSAGAHIFRGSIRKPRTNPHSFQGWPPDHVVWHSRAKAVHGLLTETEVLDVRDVEITAEHVDLLRVGARNMQNFVLLDEVGQSHRPVILKRNPSATISEWLSAAEYLLQHASCPGVILCERGIRTFETTTRYTLDLNTVAWIKKETSLPVIVDPSHASGRRDLVLPLARAAIALGADGLMIEVHEHPELALCDGSQHILPCELEELGLWVQEVGSLETGAVFV
ncbi:3-deoxy-7-phosphoheptulonate synthase [Chlamydia trachomatis]|uniref:3-deoxy-7-phosphoheptulonate synthase n=1 Tax=Chlamydia trachomatis TaxID=813 RepID=UPI0001B46F88|nr:3-deoxy-7-phosphoheptulonate synthase [Chlamydia trachomatis]AGR97530.1 3-deoxy-7-phosphoheptulonate synthase [Chlamydia trachomatis RC-J/953]AGS02181.1 3-deoxy-7-phosphoheptulonate synthase [Chlamydia trachomatis J/6276tet1]AGT70842.1 3-deoxy-7-phosphoheptulonate synthase [Chlamydia trachomatis]AGT72684.1 3-deoxy-7-phosphoheptulonate synthase [Chlamydia trachomatis]AKR32539.1 3-deoxy-7-phosphoheptulonate synthase [Chlamydia trachomatis D/CS637/11]